MIEKIFWTFVSTMVFYAGWQTAKKIGPMFQVLSMNASKMYKKLRKKEQNNQLNNLPVGEVNTPTPNMLLLLSSKDQ